MIQTTLNYNFWTPFFFEMSNIKYYRNIIRQLVVSLNKLFKHINNISYTYVGTNSPLTIVLYTVLHLIAHHLMNPHIYPLFHSFFTQYIYYFSTYQSSLIHR